MQHWSEMVNTNKKRDKHGILFENSGSHTPETWYLIDIGHMAC